MRRTLALLSLALATLPLACGGGELSPEAAVAEAATKTEDAGSARVSVTGTISGTPGGPLTFNGEGEFAEERGRITFDMSDFAEATGASFGGEFEMIFDRFVLYMKVPPELTAQIPGGKTWIRVDLKKIGKQFGIDFEDLVQFEQTDPTQLLQYLRGATDDFEKLGEDDVRGVQTAHYRGTVDLHKVAERAPEDARESFERVIELTGVTEVPIEVWIDDEGLVRRMKQKQPVQGADGEQATMTLTSDFYDFGADVDVEPPPDDEVIDLQELIQKGQ